MEPICIGEYVLKPSVIEMYRVEEIEIKKKGEPQYLLTLFLKNGTTIKEIITGEGELEEITDNLYEALKSEERK